MLTKMPEYKMNVININLDPFSSFLICLAITVGFSTIGVVVKRLAKEGMKKCQTQ